MIYEGQGFETFGAKRWLSAEDYLRYVGLRDGRCAPPELRPLEPNEAYLRFKDCYGIELSRQLERGAQVVDGATLLVAVPGSGKTTVLVARLGHLALERGIALESIVCITHTKAAAEEMRARFSRRFGRPDVAGRITFCTINKLAKDIYEDSCRRQGAVPRRVDPAAVRGILLDACRRARSGYVSEGDLVDLESVISRFSASDITPQNRHGHLVFSCLKTIQHAPDKKRATAFDRSPIRCHLGSIPHCRLDRFLGIGWTAHKNSRSICGSFPFMGNAHYPDQGIRVGTAIDALSANAALMPT